MRILQVHNRYRQAGGEDVVVANDAALLARHGHEVIPFETRSDDLDLASLGGRVRTGLRTIWSREGRRRLAAEARRHTPDVMHVHNTFPVLSPAALWAGPDAGVPVVQTLHNYRLACAAATLLRDGVPCQDCVGGSKAPAVRHACYHDARAQSLAVAAMQTLHRSAGTYRRAVAAFIALTPFMRDVMLREGLPADRVHIAPNVLPDAPASAEPPDPAPRRLAFVGRLSPEKGADLLVDAWLRAAPDGWTLDVVGDGPDAESLRARAGMRRDVVLHGWKDRDAVRDVMASARAVVLPSRWYEGFPVTLLEALAVGRPVVAPDHGAFVDTVVEGRTGWRFAPGDVDALARTLRTTTDQADDAWRSLAAAARRTFDERYTAEAGYARLIAVYDAATALHERAGTGI